MIETILNQPFLATYIVLAGFLITAGVFFDQLAGEPLKKKVSGYLQDNASFSMDLTEYTKFFVAESITKFFHGDILTANNFRRSLTVSLTSLTVVIGLYAIKNHQNPLQFLNFVDDENVYLHGFGIAVILGAVVLGDIFSILQTALLLNLVGSIRSAYDVLFLLVCDLIITINIFVFALPIGLQLAVVAHDFYGADVVFALQIPKLADKSDVDHIKDKELEKLVIDGSFQLAPVWSVANNVSQPDSQHTVPTDTPVLYKNADPVQVVHEMMRELGTSVRDVPKLEKLPEDEELMSSFLDAPHVVADVHLSSYLTFQGRAGMYAFMFDQSRIAQNVFPMVAQLQPVTLQLGEVYSEGSGWTRIPHSVARNYYVKCDGKSDFVDAVPDMKTCTSAAVIGIGESLREAYRWNYRIRPFIKEIPIAPLAFSCLFLTFSFYAVMLLSFAMIKLASLLHFVTFTYRYIDIEKSTFVSMATFACLLLVPLFAVAFAFYYIVLA
ncbi:hypothetical protein ACU8MG_22805 [Rhizobium leguminosarum]